MYTCWYVLSMIYQHTAQHYGAKAYRDMPRRAENFNRIVVYHKTALPYSSELVLVPYLFTPHTTYEYTPSANIVSHS
jgi:hypothetical protein